MATKCSPFPYQSVAAVADDLLWFRSPFINDRYPTRTRSEMPAEPLDPAERLEDYERVWVEPIIREHHISRAKAIQIMRQEQRQREQMTLRDPGLEDELR
jgi:hypothetical protein